MSIATGPAVQRSPPVLDRTTASIPGHASQRGWRVDAVFVFRHINSSRDRLMTSFRTFLKSGHAPTLFAAFLYFDFCFAIWVLNGAMAPFISEAYGLTEAQKGFMISVPILAGALMRFPLGVLAQYIGRKSAALVEMGLLVAALAYGYFFISSYDHVLAMGVLLGIAGASFGVALSLGSGWFPPRYKGLAMGIAGAGNSGTVLAV